MGLVNIVLWVAGVALIAVGYTPGAGAVGALPGSSRSRTPTSPATRRGGAACVTTARPAPRWRWRSCAARRRSGPLIAVAGVVLVFLGFLVR